MSVAERIIADLIASGPAAVATLARRIGVIVSTVSERIRRLHRRGRVHVVAWQGAQRGVYAAGAGIDAPRPAPRTVAQRSAAYKRDRPARRHARTWLVTLAAQ